MCISLSQLVGNIVIAVAGIEPYADFAAFAGNVSIRSPSMFKRYYRRSELPVVRGVLPCIPVCVIYMYAVRS